MANLNFPCANLHKVELYTSYDFAIAHQASLNGQTAESDDAPGENVHENSVRSNLPDALKDYEVNQVAYMRAKMQIIDVNTNCMYYMECPSLVCNKKLQTVTNGFLCSTCNMIYKTFVYHAMLSLQLMCDGSQIAAIAFGEPSLKLINISRSKFIYCLDSKNDALQAVVQSLKNRSNVFLVKLKPNRLNGDVEYIVEDVVDATEDTSPSTSANGSIDDSNAFDDSRKRLRSSVIGGPSKKTK